MKVFFKNICMFFVCVCACHFSAAKRKVTKRFIYQSIYNVMLCVGERHINLFLGGRKCIFMHLHVHPPTQICLCACCVCGHVNVGTCFVGGCPKYMQVCLWFCMLSEKTGLCPKVLTVEGKWRLAKKGRICNCFIFRSVCTCMHILSHKDPHISAYIPLCLQWHRPAKLRVRIYHVFAWIRSADSNTSILPCHV